MRIDQSSSAGCSAASPGAAAQRGHRHLSTHISATYDELISPTTVTSRTFAVHGMQSGLVTATHGVVNGNTIMVTPTHSFHQGELVCAVAATG